MGRHTKEAYANSFSTLGQLYLQMGRLRDGVDLLRQGLTLPGFSQREYELLVGILRRAEVLIFEFQTPEYPYSFDHCRSAAR